MLDAAEEDEIKKNTSALDRKKLETNKNENQDKKVKKSQLPILKFFDD